VDAPTGSDSTAAGGGRAGGSDIPDVTGGGGEASGEQPPAEGGEERAGQGSSESKGEAKPDSGAEDGPSRGGDDGKAAGDAAGRKGAESPKGDPLFAGIRMLEEERARLREQVRQGGEYDGRAADERRLQELFWATEREWYKVLNNAMGSGAFDRIQAILERFGQQDKEGAGQNERPDVTGAEGRSAGQAQSGAGRRPDVTGRDQGSGAAQEEGSLARGSVGGRQAI
jgi:hypothetical protein